MVEMPIWRTDPESRISLRLSTTHASRHLHRWIVQLHDVHVFGFEEIKV